MKNKILKINESNILRLSGRYSLLIAIILFISAIQKLFSQQQPWIAPAWADTVKSPLHININVIEKGKALFINTCSACHGNTGKGDGIAGVALNPRPKDLTSPVVQKQTDGAIFWKITTGRPPMASHKTILTDEQRWQVVSFIRKLNSSSK